MRLIKNCKGSISIFQCIIFMALLLLAGVIIDAARIAVAERKVQSALNTAVRSVLADYNADMVGDYNIFAVDTQSYNSMSEKNFLSYFRQNLSERNPNFRFIRYEICEETGASYIEGSKGLLGGYSFRNQVLQYMKYKAPLKATQNIFEKFRASGLTRKARFAESEQKVRAKWKTVKSQTDAVNKLIADVKESPGKDLDALKSSRQKLQEALQLNERIAGMLQDYDNEKKKSDAVAISADNDETGIKDMDISTSRVSFEGLQAASGDLKSQISANIDNLNSVIESIERLQIELTRLNVEADVLRSRLKELNKVNVENEKNNNENNKNYNEENNTSEAVEKQIAEFEARLDELENQVYEHDREIGDIQDSFKFIDMNKLPAGEDNTPKGKINAELRNSAEGLIKRLVDDIGINRTNIDSERLIDSREFEMNNQENDDKKMQSSLEGIDGILGEDEAETENKNVLNLMRKITDILADAGESSLEKLYIIEYIMDRFSYFTAEAERGHFFEKGEVEYILWGGNNWTKNVIKTIGTIWFMRFAIDTVDTFAASPIPEPVTRLINSLTEGLMLSYKDIMDLCQGKEINICPSAKTSIKVSYADHLRVCLLLASSTESGENSRLNNVRQLIQINIKELDDGFALKNYNTMLRGKVKVKVNLWFLPMLGLDKMGFKNFEGSSYVIEKEAYMEY